MKAMSARDAKHQFGLLIDTARAEPVVIEMSTSTETGPSIGAEKGPPPDGWGKRETRLTRRSF